MIPIWAPVGLCLVFLALFLMEKRRTGLLAAKLAEAEAALAKLRAAPQTYEYRVELFELVWHPTLTCSPQDKTVTAAVAGLPHCRKCAGALRSEGREWVCPKCGDRRPETVADTMVIDSVIKEAVKWFLERHPDYRAALGRS